MSNFSISVYHNILTTKLLKLQEKIILQESEIKDLEQQLIQSLQDFISVGHQNLMLIREILDLKSENQN
jgi:uncharacterized protein (UPF0335 family)